MYKQILFISFLAILVGSCNSAEETLSTYTIAFDEIIDHDKNLSVLFADVIGDSRCPTNVVCVWEGQAEVQLDLIFQNDMVHSVILIDRVNHDEQRDTTFSDYYIKLIEVLPYPEEPQQIEKEDYEIRLLIEAL
jgi:hypothetical protein